MTKDIEKFNQCQCGRIIGEGMDILVSYNTPIAIVDKPANKIYKGKYAQGYSRTTSKQFGQMINKWYYRCDIVERDSEEYKKFIEVNNIDNDWDKFNNSTWNFSNNYRMYGYW